MLCILSLSTRMLRAIAIRLKQFETFWLAKVAVQLVVSHPALPRNWQQVKLASRCKITQPAVRIGRRHYRVQLLSQVWRVRLRLEVWQVANLAKPLGQRTK